MSRGKEWCSLILSILLQALARLSCAFKTENQTRMVVCDLGNPMKAGTKVRFGPTGVWEFKQEGSCCFSQSQVVFEQDVYWLEAEIKSSWHLATHVWLVQWKLVLISWVNWSLKGVFVFVSFMMQLKICSSKNRAISAFWSLMSFVFRSIKYWFFWYVIKS